MGGLQREVEVGMGHFVLVFVVAGLVEVIGLAEVEVGLPVLTGRQGTVITVVVGMPGPLGTEGGL